MNRWGITEAIGKSGIVLMLSFGFGMAYIVWATTSAYYQDSLLDAKRDFLQQAIDNGAAYYDPTTGEVKWIKREPVKITRSKVMQNPDGSIYIESMEGEK